MVGLVGGLTVGVLVDDLTAGDEDGVIVDTDGRGTFVGGEIHLVEVVALFGESAHGGVRGGEDLGSLVGAETEGERGDGLVGGKSLEGRVEGHTLETEAVDGAVDVAGDNLKACTQGDGREGGGPRRGREREGEGRYFRPEGSR